MGADDFLADILGRIQEMLGDDAMTSDEAIRLEAEIRRDWGGDRPYIGKTKFDRDERNNRDQKLYRDHKAGEHVPLLARRYKISTRQVRRIIAAQREVEIDDRRRQRTRLP